MPDERFLVELNIPRPIYHVIRVRPGYVTQLVPDDLVEFDPRIIDHAVEHEKVLITRDSDFTKEANYPICNNPGVLYIAIRPIIPRRVVQPLRKLLACPHLYLIHHAITFLHDDMAVVKTRNGVYQIDGPRFKDLHELT